MRRVRIPGCPLTISEFKVLEYAVRFPGATPGRLAEELDCSVNTARTHLANIHEKMGVSTHTEMVVRAVQYGWVALPEPPLPRFTWRLRRHDKVEA
ncbi:MAG: response regulator transcription factor [Armatimonadota bacterium]